MGSRRIISQGSPAHNGPDGSFPPVIGPARAAARGTSSTPGDATGEPFGQACGEMSPPDDSQRDDGVVAAASKVALYPARAAMRASRTRIEASVEGVLTGPELARLVDAVLAGPFPEELAHILVERKVIERVVAKMADEVEVADLVDQVLARPEVRDAVARAVGSDATHALLKQTLEHQTSSFAGDLAQSLRVHARALDARVDLRHPPAPEKFGGVVTRAIALVTDAVLISLIGASISAMATLVASLVGTLRPAWLVGLILACGWSVLCVVYFAGCWSLVGKTPGMMLMHVRVRGPRGEQPSFGRSLVRVLGLALAIIPCFAGFIPALFDGRRRALPDLLARTTVEADVRPTAV